MIKRATYRRSKAGSARHNDRQFNVDAAAHIKKENEAENVYLTFEADGTAFEPVRGVEETAFAEHERRIYADLFGEALAATNEKYRRQGHAERCKTIDDWIRAEKTKPTEEIYQIGDMRTQQGDPISREAFEACVKEFIRFKIDWSRSHGDCLHVLDLAFHLDEATPHAHEREIFSYIDADGNRRIGQEKALEQAGIQLPDPKNPESRYNNRMMTLTAQFRKKWYAIIEAKGIQIERKPRPSRRHKEKADYINDQIAAENEKLINENKRLSRKVKKTATQAEILLDAIEDTLDQLPDPELGEMCLDYLSGQDVDRSRLADALAEWERTRGRER